MTFTPDTNVLVRLVVQDDPLQTEAAFEALKAAQVVALSTTSLSELVWVLRSSYRMRRADVAGVLEGLISASNIEVDRAAVEFGLAVLAAGGDFADGVIAFEGRSLGGETFVSFDRRAVAAVAKSGRKSQLLGSKLV